jgi:solute:Na+ symporter, SSS family
MPANLIVLTIVIIYLGGTTLIGLWQSRKVKEAKDFANSKLSVWRAGLFLAGMTLGGGATYGIAGDSVKYGLTYLICFPLSLILGWWLTGLAFARPYFRLNGLSVPAIMENRFGKNTHTATTICTMVYSIFVMVLEIYALALIVRSIFPDLPMINAVLISVTVSVLSVSFSGIMGASLVSLIYSGTIVIALSVSLFILWNTVGGFTQAVALITPNLKSISGLNIAPVVWVSATGLGLAIVGQIMLGKVSHLGGISIVSNAAASCKSESHAVLAFGIAGLGAGIPPFMAGLLGIFSAALIGPISSSLPSYSYIGLALMKISPYLAGLLLAAFAAAILSAFGPVAIGASNVFVDEILGRIIKLTDQQKRHFYTLTIFIISIMSAIYVALGKITDILPFLFLTAIPCMAPITVVMFFGLYNKRITKDYAIWAIIIGISSALIWGLILDEPFKIPNIYLSFFIPILIMSIGALKNRKRNLVQEPVPSSFYNYDPE